VDKPNDPVTQKDLGQLLKHTREGAGLTVSEAGRKLGRRPWIIRGIESGATTVPVETWMLMFQVYGGEIKVRGNPPTLILRRG